MSIKTALFCAVLGVTAIAAPLTSQARVYIDVDVAPPAAQVEVIPAARAGYVWAPGYWNWQGHRHVWVRGHYIRGHRGHHWVADGWNDHNGKWRYSRGHWDRD